MTATIFRGVVEEMVVVCAGGDGDGDGERACSLVWPLISGGEDPKQDSNTVDVDGQVRKTRRGACQLGQCCTCLFCINHPGGTHLPQRYPTAKYSIMYLQPVCTCA